MSDSTARVRASDGARACDDRSGDLGGRRWRTRLRRSSGDGGRGGGEAAEIKKPSVGRRGTRRTHIYDGGLLSRVEPPPGTKGVFGRAGKIPSPRPTFSPGWIYHPGQKGPVFPRSRLMLCLFLFLLTSLLKLAFIC